MRSGVQAPLWRILTFSRFFEPARALAIVLDMGESRMEGAIDGLVLLEGGNDVRGFIQLQAHALKAAQVQIAELKASHRVQMDALQARVSALELLVMVAKPEQNQA